MQKTTEDAFSSVTPKESASPPVTTPAGRRAVPEPVSSVVVPARVLALATSKDDLFYVTAGNEKTTVRAHKIASGAERSLADLGFTSSVSSIRNLAAVGDALVWAERRRDDDAGTFAIVGMNADGSRRRDLLPAAFGGPLLRGSAEVSFHHGENIYVLGGDLAPRVVVSSRVDPRAKAPPKDLLNADGGLHRMDVWYAETVASDNAWVYWTTTEGMWRAPRRGGPITRELESPAKQGFEIRGVVDGRVFYTDGQSLWAKEHGGDPVEIAGDGGGRLMSTRVAGSDLYFLVLWFVGAGETQSIVYRIRHRATRAEALVEARDFDVAGDTLYFSTTDGIRATAR
jgi:hypothetical protein